MAEVVLRRISEKTGIEAMTLLGGFMVLLIFGGSALVFSGVVSRATQEKGDTVRARFATTLKLKPGDPVRVDGTNIGRVRKTELDAGGRSSTAEFEVFKNAMPVYRDARASIKWRSVLGGAYAVDLDRGTPAAGDLDGSVIPQRHTSSQVEVTDVVSTLDGPRRQALRGIIDETPKALRSSRNPARSLRSLADASPSIETATRALRGEEAGDLPELIKNSSRAVGALDRPAEPLTRLISSTGRTLRVTSGRADDIRSILSQGASVQPLVRQTLADLNVTLRKADPVVDELDDAAPDVAPTLDRLQPVVVKADRVLRRARPLLRNLPPTSRSLAGVAANGVPVLDGLTPSIERIDTTVLPGLAKPDGDTKIPAYWAIGPAIADLNGGAASFDGTSRVFRFPASGGERAVDTIPCKTYLTDPTEAQKVQCQELGNIVGQILGGPVSSAKKRGDAADRKGGRR